MEDTSNSESWTTKYNPLTIKELIGNINVIKDGVRYLKNYKSEKSAKADFHKAILISGPSGTGKTEFAKLLALYRGYIPVERLHSDDPGRATRLPAQVPGPVETACPHACFP